MAGKSLSVPVALLPVAPRCIREQQNRIDGLQVCRASVGDSASIVSFMLTSALNMHSSILEEEMKAYVHEFTKETQMIHSSIDVCVYQTDPDSVILLDVLGVKVKGNPVVRKGGD